MANSLPRYTGAILAFCLSLLLSFSLSHTLGLGAYNQYDFWLVCLISSLLFGLPMTIMEVALARRARATPLQGMLQLTRDADVSIRWRGLTWLAVILLPLTVGALLAFPSHLPINRAGDQIGWIGQLVLCLAAVGCSLLPRGVLLAVALVAGWIMSDLAWLQTPAMDWSWTAFELSEWTRVLVLSIVCAGLGLGMYWQYYPQHDGPQQATRSALPIWLAQLGGLLVFAVVQGRIGSSMQVWALIVANLALSGLILQAARDQLVARQVPLPLQALILLLPLLVWVIPSSHQVLYLLLIILSLATALGYTIFVGWLMKISHVRKSINFSSEAIYNLWRVLMRIGLPLAVIFALAGLIWQG